MIDITDSSLLLSVKEVAQNNREFGAIIERQRYPSVKLRPYQRWFWRKFVNSRLFSSPLADRGLRPENDIRYFYPIWCRRAGKDFMSFQMACAYASMHKNVNVLYLFPRLKQGVESVFEGKIHMGKGADNISFMDMLGEGAKVNNQRFKIFLPNKSTITFGAADEYGYYRGIGPSLIVYSEYCWHHPEAEIAFEPMLAGNMGSAIYPTTPNGRNFAYDRIRNAILNDGSNVGKLPYIDKGSCSNDTLVRIWSWNKLCDDEGYGIMSKKDIDKICDSKGFSKEMRDQEFNCAFIRAGVGTVFGREMEIMRADGRLRSSVPVNRSGRFFTAWDLGNQDDTAIWIINEGKDGKFYAIDFIRDNCRALEAFIDDIKRWEATYDLRIDTHFFPHDMAAEKQGVKVNSSGTQFVPSQRLKNAALKDIAEAEGLTPTVVRKPQHKDDGVALVRRILGMMVIDESKSKCEYGVKSLYNYRRTTAPKTMVVSDKPLRDWTCHAVDALQTFALGIAEERGDVLNPVSSSRPGRRAKRSTDVKKKRKSKHGWMY